MRILLDNCMPVRFTTYLRGYKVETALSMGWDLKSDRELLDLMTGKFDVLITVDKKLAAQNRVASRNFGVITLRAKSNRMQDLLHFYPNSRRP